MIRAMILHKLVKKNIFSEKEALDIVNIKSLYLSLVSKNIISDFGKGDILLADKIENIVNDEDNSLSTKHKALLKLRGKFKDKQSNVILDSVTEKLGKFLNG
jgi:hypothetical protein